MSSGYYRLGANVPGKRLELQEAMRDPVAFARLTGFPEPTQWQQEVIRTLAEDDKPDAIDVQSPLTPQQMGYTGDLCHNCQSTRVLRTGHCSTCQDCGTTTDCA